MKKLVFLFVIIFLLINLTTGCNKPGNNQVTNPSSNWWMPKGHFYGKSFHPGHDLAPPLVEAWKHDYELEIINAPIFGNNKIIFQHNNSIDANKVFRAISSIDGTTLWNFPTMEIAWNSCACANGNVYFCGTYNRIPKLYSVNESNGTLNWSVVLPEFPNNITYNLNSPMAIAYGAIYIPAVSYEPKHKAVFVLNQHTGELLRRLDFNDNNDCNLVIGFGKLFITSGNRLYAYSDTDNQQRWVSQEFDGRILNLTIHNEVKVGESPLVLFTVRKTETDSVISVVGLDISTGTLKWQNIFSVNMRSVPNGQFDSHAWFRSITLAGDILLVTFGNRIIAYNATTGILLWAHNESLGQYLFQSVSSNGFLYCIYSVTTLLNSSSYYLRIFNIQSGELTNTYEFSGGIMYGFGGDNDKEIMAIDNGLIVISLGNRVIAFRKNI